MISILSDQAENNVIKFLFEDKIEDSFNVSSIFKAGLNKSMVIFKDGFKVLVGLGKYDDFYKQSIREAVAVGARCAKDSHLTEVIIDITSFIEDFGVDILYDVVDGIKLGTYKFKGYGTKNEEETDVHFILKGIDGSMKDLLSSAIILTDSVIYARNIVNMPANMLTPEALTKNVYETLRGFDIVCEILDDKQITILNMNLLHAVGSSSGNPLRFIILKYMGNPNSSEITALVGKGVTFDTGGYCLKPDASMLTMKCDMGGAATVISSIYAIAKNKVKANVVALIPACENRISNKSFLPGDVLKSMSGKTVEIINTDAEGRLILADAVTYAIKHCKATRVIDVATLTGAAVAAFGHTVSPVLCNNDDLWNEFLSASEFANEQYLRLPILNEHKEMIKSEIADIKNTGGKTCGIMTAGLFVGEFVGDIPWMHIDIAGTGWVDTPAYKYQSKGGTGFGIRTLYNLFYNS